MDKEITCVDNCTDCLLFDDNSGICEESIIFINNYEHCNTKWTSSHDCKCNDRCPICDKEIEPIEGRQVMNNSLDEVCTLIVNESNFNDENKNLLIDLISDVQNKIDELNEGGKR